MIYLSSAVLYIVGCIPQVQELHKAKGPLRLLHGDQNSRNHGKPGHGAISGRHDATYWGLQHTAFEIPSKSNLSEDVSSTNVSQDLQCVANCDSKNPDEIRRFSMPVIQTFVIGPPDTMFCSHLVELKCTWEKWVAGWLCSAFTFTKDS